MHRAGTPRAGIVDERAAYRIDRQVRSGSFLDSVCYGTHVEIGAYGRKGKTDSRMITGTLIFGELISLEFFIFFIFCMFRSVLRFDGFVAEQPLVPPFFFSAFFPLLDSAVQRTAFLLSPSLYISYLSSAPVFLLFLITITKLGRSRGKNIDNCTAIL
jgi:hypothetical protein